MSDKPQATSHIAALEKKIARLQRSRSLSDAADEALEFCLREQRGLERSLDALFPVLSQYTGATRAWVRCPDENLKFRDFFWSVDDDEVWPVDLTEIANTVLASPFSVQREQAGQWVVAQNIDVAGESFGCTALCAPPKEEDCIEDLAELLHTWCEQLDNHLAAIAQARRKHQIISELSTALRPPVLGKGIHNALDVLQRHIELDDLLLVYRHEDDEDGSTLAYWIVKQGNLLHDSRNPGDPEVDRFMREHGVGMLLRDESSAVAAHFGMRRFRDEVLINGVVDTHIVGRLLVSRHDGHDFSAFDRDLLERFADFLRQRIVDFNKDWRLLSQAFAPPTIQRLLSEADYVRQYLEPRERDVAILFCDISGFTRVSEQILKKPRLIGKLVDMWSERVVDMIWASGGVFDKMVGDCIIGMWGPPFFDIAPQEACRRAAQTALQVRTFTEALGDQGELPELHDLDPPMTVSTGLNFCSLYVGLFGPNKNYTGFSSGMNNTARLQGVAAPGEILCMQSFATTLDKAALFGELRHERVKNVAEPLAFHALQGISS